MSREVHAGFSEGLGVKFPRSTQPFVGDRGMIKSRQVEALLDYGFHYITAITKPQIESLITKGVIQLGLFDQELAEVLGDDGVRYVLRRNPIRANEMKQSRSSRLSSLERIVEKQNLYLSEHPRARDDVALRKVLQYSEKLRICKWVSSEIVDRKITLIIDQDTLAEETKLDGCYVLKTDLHKKEASKETIHDRYKDLSSVEWAFRMSKTVELEMRPIHVRLATRTRGHVFIVMLAYRIVQELAIRWSSINLTVEEGIKELSTLCATDMLVKDDPRCSKIPQPRKSVRELLKSAKVTLPEIFPCRGIRVATRKKLTSNRKVS